jgi:hypothetical protein
LIRHSVTASPSCPLALNFMRLVWLMAIPQISFQNSAIRSYLDIW